MFSCVREAEGAEAALREAFDDDVMRDLRRLVDEALTLDDEPVPHVELHRRIACAGPDERRDLAGTQAPCFDQQRAHPATLEVRLRRHAAQLHRRLASIRVGNPGGHRHQRITMANAEMPSRSNCS